MTTIAPPLRVVRTFTQRYRAAAQHVFPLLCPVRECDWIDGWKPALVLSNSGYAELDCTFITGDDDARALWTTTRHEPDNGLIEFVRFGPHDVVSRISIHVQPTADDACTADIRYQHTALSHHADAFIASFSEAHFSSFMEVWQRRLQFYLDTGRMLPAEVA
jgi:hypothetical protein